MCWEGLRQSRFFNKVVDFYRKHDKSEEKVEVNDLDKDQFSMRGFMKYVGPGFLVSVAYIDPGNLTADIVSGGSFNYSLLGVRRYYN